MSNSGGKPLTMKDLQDAINALGTSSSWQVWQSAYQQSMTFQQARMQQQMQAPSKFYGMGLGSLMGRGSLIGGSLGFDPAYKPAHREPLPVEHATTPLVAYRTWKIEREDSKTREWNQILAATPWQAAKAIKQKIAGAEPRTDYFLHSVTAGVRWEGPILRADGKPADFKEDAFRAWERGNDNAAPHGIYAYKNGARAMEEAHLGRDFSPAEAIACGRIELFGKIVEHEYGYRAEACRITHLRLAPQTVAAHPGIIEQFEQRYECQVETWNGDW